jgi:hypothetical protein
MRTLGIVLGALFLSQPALAVRCAHDGSFCWAETGEDLAPPRAKELPEDSVVDENGNAVAAPKGTDENELKKYLTTAVRDYMVNVLKIDANDFDGLVAKTFQEFAESVKDEESGDRFTGLSEKGLARLFAKLQKKRSQGGIGLYLPASPELVAWKVFPKIRNSSSDKYVRRETVEAYLRGQARLYANR